MKKKSKSKSYRVRSSSWKMIIEIQDFFDDPFVEACTRCIEIKKDEEDAFNVNPVMICTCIETKKEKTINTYKILQNAGLGEKAEFLRHKFLQLSEIDLSKEPMSSSLS